MDKLNKKGLQKLLDETVESLTEVLKKAETEGLAKTDPGEEAPAEKTPSKEASESSPEESSPAEASESAPPAAPAEEAAPPAAPAEGTGDPAQEMGGQVSVESLQAEYQAMPIEDLKMHVLAAKAALMTHLTAGQEQMGAGDPAAQAPPPAAPMAPPMAPPAAEAAPPMAPPVLKSETDPAVLEKLQSLEKSLKEKDEVIQGFGKVAEGLKNLLVSNRKSAHSISLVSKPGESLSKSEKDVSTLSKAEVDRELKEAIRSGNLSKADKDLIVQFTAGSTHDVSKVAHLINRK